MIPVCQAEEGTVAGAGSPRFSTRVQLALGACACGGGATFLYLVDPNHYAVYPPCLLYQTTGIYCAGCGATRALYALLHGRVLEALHDNALFVTALPFLFWLAGSYVLPAWQTNAWPEFRGDPRQLARRGIGLLLVMLGFMALRNLPGWPFDWLKPVILH